MQTERGVREREGRKDSERVKIERNERKREREK